MVETLSNCLKTIALFWGKNTTLLNPASYTTRRLPLGLSFTLSIVPPSPLDAYPLIILVYQSSVVHRKRNIFPLWQTPSWLFFRDGEVTLFRLLVDDVSLTASLPTLWFIR